MRASGRPTRVRLAPRKPTRRWIAAKCREVANQSGASATKPHVGGWTRRCHPPNGVQSTGLRPPSNQAASRSAQKLAFAALPSGFPAEKGMSTPMRRVRSGCCACRERPRCRRATNKGDEFPPSHGVTRPRITDVSISRPALGRPRPGHRAFKSIAALLNLWHIFQRLALVPSFVAAPMQIGERQL
jgi:hypothetical protein